MLMCLFTLPNFAGYSMCLHTMGWHAAMKADGSGKQEHINKTAFSLEILGNEFSQEWRYVF